MSKFSIYNDKSKSEKIDFQMKEKLNRGEKYDFR